MKIIAFAHRQNVGKDTAAQFLVSHLRTSGGRSVDVRKAGFADKLKSVSHDLYGWAGVQPGEFYEHGPNRHLKDVALPMIGKSPRAVWIAIGNGLRDLVYDGTWLTYLLRSIRCDVLVVKDMRFPIEAYAILAGGGSVYRIDRPSVPKVDDGADDPLEGFADWTGVIRNDGSLHELHRKVVEIAEGLLLPTA